VLILFCTKNIVKLESESVQVANVERAEVVVECVVEELIIDSEVAWRLAGVFGWKR
jgi:hypothetical protein